MVVINVFGEEVCQDYMNKDSNCLDTDISDEDNVSRIVVATCTF